jgi:colanic acid/amylovoran biosynthesis glycosyltransferase
LIYSLSLILFQKLFIIALKIIRKSGAEQVSKVSNILIYRDLLLQFSETFVLNQAESLKLHIPYYVGSRAIQGLSLPKRRTFLVNEGATLDKLSELFSRLGRFPPDFLKQLKKLNSTLIHAHFGQDAAMALTLAKNLNIPLIVTFHGYDITVKDKYVSPSLGQWIYLKRRKELKHKAQLFVAVSEFIKSKLIEQSFPPEKIICHYIGIDTKLFKPDFNIQREQIVLFVGRLVEKKGCEYLIKAMAQVQAKNPGVKLLVIGDGDLRSSLENLSEKLLKNYQFLGIQSPEKVRHWMQQSKIFCVPSVTAKSGDAEGFGLVFTEAQSMGLPVVSFASGGIPEAVSHGETGFLVPERDIDGLATYILRLLGSTDLWEKMSTNGRLRVDSLFNLEKQTRLLEDLYAQVLKASPSDLKLRTKSDPMFS